MKDLDNPQKASTFWKWVSPCPAGKIWDGVWEHQDLKEGLGVFCEVLSFLLTSFWGTGKPRRCTNSAHGHDELSTILDSLGLTLTIVLRREP